MSDPEQGLDDVKTRRATASDAAQLAALAVHVWLEIYSTQGVAREDAAHVFAVFTPRVVSELLGNPRRVLYVAERQDCLLGFSQACLSVPHAEVSARLPVELERLYVQSRSHGRGIGRRLLAEAEAFAAANGADAIWLTVWVENERALEFYARSGYTDIAETRFCYEGQEVLNRLLVKHDVGA